jgi:hypothetical protein
MHDKLARRQADPNALSNLSLTPSLPLRRYRFQDGLDVADCKVSRSRVRNCR